MASGKRPGFGFSSWTNALFFFIWAGSVAIGLLTGLIGLAYPWALPFALLAALTLHIALQGRLQSYREHARVQALFTVANEAHRAASTAAVDQVIFVTAEQILRTPLRVSGEPPADSEIGAAIPGSDEHLIATKRRLHPFSVVDRNLLEVLAALLASAREGARARAQEAEAARDEMLATVVHELRTPLTSMIGFTQTLRAGRFADPQPALEQIALAGEHMKRLIDDLLELQRARQARFGTERRPLDLGQLLRDQVERYRGQSEAHELRLEQPEAPIYVLADEERLGQVVANLISNAIKYSPAGGPVVVTARQVDERVRVEVRDWGLGVPEEDRARLFTRFFRAGGPSRQIAGTGLGLAIAQELVEAHEGQIGYEAPDEGSLFYFELPLAAGVLG